MSAYTTDCPALDVCGPCGTLPPGFVRLRYFFGKRMGVADFLDEQRYHAGKQRFHNQRLHGAGLLCGLAVGRQSATDLILRVGKGAAVDACGREIVVGYDQCIDLEAWYQRVVAEARSTQPDWPLPVLDGGNLRVVVAIRYRECGAAPEPAPRDPCSCDAAGCDFGRVREEFELELFLPDAPEVLEATPLTPTREALERVLGRATGSGAIERGLAAAASTGCADPDTSAWLLLAELVLSFDPAPTAGDPGRLDDVVSITGRASLLAETALLQELLLRTLGAQLEAGALNRGPEISGISVVPDTGSFYWLDLTLTGDVVARSVAAGAFLLQRFDPAAVSPAPLWQPRVVVTTFVAATATTPPRLRLRLDNTGNFLADGGMYRLVTDPAVVTSTAPIIDAEMRPLKPLRPVFQFGIAEVAPATLAVAPAPYAQ